MLATMRRRERQNRKGNEVLDIIRIVLETGNFIELHTADTDFYSEGCDSAIDYTLYDQNYQEIDGGQMDYSSQKKNYEKTEDAIPDVIMFALGVKKVPNYYIL